jgi:hypothetical protein
MALVFSKGEWITVPLPSDSETWSFSDQLLYGTTFAYATRERKVPLATASQIAEAVVFKRLYPGMKMNESIEKMITWLQFNDPRNHEAST